LAFISKPSQTHTPNRVKQIKMANIRENGFPTI
jgi:hypothetical protein